MHWLNCFAGRLIVPVPQQVGALSASRFRLSVTAGLRGVLTAAVLPAPRPSPPALSQSWGRCGAGTAAEGGSSHRFSLLQEPRETRSEDRAGPGWREGREDQPWRRSSAALEGQSAQSWRWPPLPFLRASLRVSNSTHSTIQQRRGSLCSLIPTAWTLRSEVFWANAETPCRVLLCCLSHRSGLTGVCVVGPLRLCTSHCSEPACALAQSCCCAPSLARVQSCLFADSWSLHAAHNFSLHPLCMCNHGES